MTNLYSVSYENRSKAYSSRVRFLVLHYTAANYKVSLDILVNKLSSHYLVPDPIDSTYPYGNDIKIFNLVDEKERAWHAGVSYWDKRYNLNDQSIGIENVNMAFQNLDGSIHFVPFNDKQVDAIIQLCQNIIARYPQITPVNVVGHSDISIGRKSDPGALFPWKKLYDAGVGAWYDECTKNKYEEQFQTTSLPIIGEVQGKFQKYGYQIDVNNVLDKHTKNTIRAFQLHFRQSKYDGVLDIETCAILYALVEKYR